MYTDWLLPGAGRLRGPVSRKAKLRIQAPVNGGGNYNHPKVAKFLVGEVPTCTNGVTTSPLSQPQARRKCTTSKDARYARQDGKTPGPSLQLDIGIWMSLCR